MPTESTRASWREWYHRNKSVDRERQTRRKNDMIAYLKAHKLDKGCYVCGYNKSSAALCFHHKDPSTKSFELSHARKSWRSTRREIAKCDVLCLNCHAELHESGDCSSGGEDADVPNQLMLFESNLELT